MQLKRLVISTGFALFSMFFGSGNLVFPITVGQESGGHFIAGALGIFLTGVLVPFLGVLGMMLYKGDIQNFFSPFGKQGTFVFSLIALSLMGPFGVLARCITVVHGSLLLLLPNISLFITSIIMCGVIYLVALNKNKIVPILGSFLTPFLLLSIGTIAFFGFRNGSLPATAGISPWKALKNGFFQGYQTMDLLAAFFFSKFVIKHLYNRKGRPSEDKLTIKIFFYAALIGASMLSVFYFVLVSLGWLYSPILLDTLPQEMLGVIAMEALGPLAAPFVCLAVILACLTTAVVLASLFADFLKGEVCQNRVSHSSSLLITLFIGCSISNLDFGGIARFLGPILEIAYPALITLTIVNIFSRFCSFKPTHWPFTATLIIKLLFIN